MPELSTFFSECVLAFDPDRSKFLFISPGIYPILGYSAADFYRNELLLSEIIYPDDSYRIKLLGSNLSLGKPVELAYRIVTPQGEVKRIIEKRELIPDENTGHTVLVSIIKIAPPENPPDDSRISKQFLKSLIDSQTNFLIRLDAAGNFIFVNKEFLKVFGYRKNEILGKHFSYTVIPDERDGYQKAYSNCVKNPGKVIFLSEKKSDKGGNVHNTEWEFIAIANAEGKVSEIQGVGADITRKLTIEKEAKKTAEKLDAFIESVTDSFFIINTDWQFVKINAAFEKMFNTQREELLGKVLWDMFPLTIDTPFELAYRKAVAENVEVNFTEYVAEFNMWFNTRVYPSADGITVFIKDMSEEKRAQEELIWTKNSLEALINNTEDQIWSVDKETRYVYMNQAYRTQIAYLSGIEPKEGDYSYRHSGYDEQIISRWKKYYSRALNGEIYTIVNESIDPGTNELLSFEISFNPIYNSNNEITGAGCFAREITRRLRTERAITDQNDRLRYIASLTSHELRRPVASMLGLINIMDRKNFFNPDNKEIIEHLLTVGNEIDEVIRLIVDKTFTGDIPGQETIL